ncbi:hypothetical protein [Bathymodiolus japonicus methanotrophic gill symbiont]|uniref:hypothetical protein n=1 Tax=Bathymodiolus japonicus methanotrophic gill symbiont TaxID=113269 RepID=UPI001C8E5630|nr:hypothetical protein [Bathymodiolus japonicus methanotrophic gill symbiont]
MAFYFVSTFANAQTPTKQRPYGYRGLKIFTSLRLRFPDFQRMPPKWYNIGSVAIIIKSADLLVFRHNYPAKAINCL